MEAKGRKASAASAKKKAAGKADLKAACRDATKAGGVDATKVTGKVTDKDAGKDATKAKGAKSGTSTETPLKMYVCLDVSGSIRGGGECIYPEWVAKDVKTLRSATHFVLWGSSAVTRPSSKEVLKYLADRTQCLGGTLPQTFIEKLPEAGVIDLHVYTDGEVSEHSVEEARQDLAAKHADLRIRNVVITYVNRNLDQMNVGLSAIFDGHVLEMHRTRIADGKKVHEFDAAPLDGDVSIQDIMSAHIGLDKTEEDMTLGMHYLGQRFANADPKKRQDIRRLVREYVAAVNAEHRSRTLGEAEERALLDAVAAADWAAARAPFVGHAVPNAVKLVQAYCQKFLNETKNGALIRVSAYAPMLLTGAADKKGNELDEHEDVLVDHIMYLGLGTEAVIVLPVSQGHEQSERKRVLGNHVKCALKFDCRLNFDNTFGLQTLLALREAEEEHGVARRHGHGLDRLSAQLHGEPALDSTTLSSGAESYGINPFTRQPLECVFLVPASLDGLPEPETRLRELDAWNAHMLSRCVRQGRTMPSVPLTLALVLERSFARWRAERLSAEDAAEAARLTAVCRAYIARLDTPLTFSEGLPVVIHGTFATAARLACGVLASALDPTLPVDVLTQFWAYMEEDDAREVWAALRPYAGLMAGLAEDAPFPEAEFRTLSALASGSQYRKSGRDAALRARKGRAYSLRMYVKWLEHLAAKGCHPARLRVEELAVREDILGVPASVPLLCLHGCVPEECKPLDDEPLETVCSTTGKPTLLNKATLDMWYVGQPRDAVHRACDSLHKAMWQLARKTTKAKKLRGDQFPPDRQVFLDYVNRRVRAFHLEQGGDVRDGQGDRGSGRLLPTLPCARLVRDATLVYEAYRVLHERADAADADLDRAEFAKMLARPRSVCASGSCCEYIRKAVTKEQLAWIDAHATLEQVADDKDVLSGKLSYRQVVAT